MRTTYVHYHVFGCVKGFVTLEYVLGGLYNANWSIQ